MTREQLGARSGFESEGGTFKNYLRTLRNAGVAEIRSNGVSLSPAMFPERRNR